jgi:hypothetical protein
MVGPPKGLSCTWVLLSTDGYSITHLLPLPQAIFPLKQPLIVRYSIFAVYEAVREVGKLA